MKTRFRTLRIFLGVGHFWRSASHFLWKSIFCVCVQQIKKYRKDKFIFLNRKMQVDFYFILCSNWCRIYNSYFYTSFSAKKKIYRFFKRFFVCHWCQICPLSMHFILHAKNMFINHIETYQKFCRFSIFFSLSATGAAG